MTTAKGTRPIDGAALIAVERARQKAPKDEGGEGWDADHDAGHADELALAAACYAIPEDRRKIDDETTNVRTRVRLWSVLWPWAEQWWKPVPNDRVRELIKAGALIAAAIDDELARESSG
jgi:hypothetical protein